MKRRHLLVIGVLVFLCSAVLQAPAATIYGWLAPEAASLQLTGISGTVSNGRAAQLSLGGQPAIGNLGWQFQPLQLLLGRASLRLSGGDQGTLVDGTVFALPSGTVVVRDFRLNGPVKALLTAFGQAFVPVEGTAGIDLSELRLRQAWPQSAAGTLTVRGLAWKLGRDPVPLGDFEALFENETGGIRATLRSLGGALELQGEGSVGLDRRYATELRMKPKPDAQPLVTNLVKNLGAPDRQGWYRLLRNGEVPLPESGLEALPEEAPEQYSEEAADPDAE